MSVRFIRSTTYTLYTECVDHVIVWRMMKYRRTRLGLYFIFLGLALSTHGTPSQSPDP